MKKSENVKWRYLKKFGSVLGYSQLNGRHCDRFSLKYHEILNVSHCRACQRAKDLRKFLDRVWCLSNICTCSTMLWGTFWKRLVSSLECAILQFREFIIDTCENNQMTILVSIKRHFPLKTRVFLRFKQPAETQLQLLGIENSVSLYLAFVIRSGSVIVGYLFGSTFFSKVFLRGTITSRFPTK